MSNDVLQVNVAELINRVLEYNLTKDNSCILFGLGVNDPKGVFGTTLGLKDKFGLDRVFETPTAENAMTGMGIGLSLNGYKPIMVHQRLDFFLLAMDQLVNSAAKWNFMFGSSKNVPITIRLILGHGWGQGPTHSQNLHAWFAHVPGLKVVMPAFATDVPGLLNSSIADPNPVIFIEDRWLHGQLSKSDEVKVTIPLGIANRVSSGEDVTIVSSGYASVLSLQATNYLKKIGVGVDLIDLRSIKPLDENLIFDSVKKTGKVLVVDSGPFFASFGSHVISRIVEECFENLIVAPKLIANPDVPEPTSYGVIGEFKINAIKIATGALKMLGKSLPIDLSNSLAPKYVDASDENFIGPF
mgnify:CR=1 FL=1